MQFLPQRFSLRGQFLINTPAIVSPAFALLSYTFKASSKTSGFITSPILKGSKRRSVISFGLFDSSQLGKDLPELKRPLICQFLNGPKLGLMCFFEVAEYL